MVCNRCKETGVQSFALNQWFWYCRNCKDEIRLEESPRQLIDIKTDSNDFIFSSGMDEWMKAISKNLDKAIMDSMVYGQGVAPVPKFDYHVGPACQDNDDDEDES